MHCFAPVLTLVLSVATLATAVLPADGQDGLLDRPVSFWLRGLKDSRPQVRRGAAFALGKSSSRDALSGLVQALGDPEGNVRDAAAYALGELAADGHSGAVWAAAGQQLLKLLAKDSSPKVRRSAGFAAGSCGTEAAEARAALLAALGDPEPMVRQNAAWALGRLGPDPAAGASAGLARALSDQDPGVRRDAAAALGDLGGPAPLAAVSALLACARQEKEAFVQKVVLDSLVKLAGPQNKDLAAELGRLLKEGDTPAARAAALALGKIGGSDAEVAVPILKRVLQDDDASVRELAAAALANIGQPAAPAVAVLTEALADRSPSVRRNAALALARIGTPSAPAAPALARALGVDNQPDDVRVYLAEALGKIGPAVSPVVDALLRALKEDGNQLVRQRVIYALFHVPDNAPRAEAIVTTLESVLHEQGRNQVIVRYDAARALAFRLKDKTPSSAVSVLLEMLQDKGLRLYTGSASTLQTGDERSGSSTAVKENLGGDARYLAAEALAEVGSTANRKDVVDALEKASVSPDAEMQQAAREALDRIKGRRR
jgi:HEAT repeat protein